MAKPKVGPHGPPVAQNRRARFDYFIEETVEAGIMLAGTEVKALRNGRASISESYAGEYDGTLHLINAHIPPYQHAGRHLQHGERRPRKLLLHKREQERLRGLIRREGVTLVPTQIYFNPRGIAKVEIGLARGKKKADKRETEKQRDWGREKARLMRDKG